MLKLSAKEVLKALGLDEKYAGSFSETGDGLSFSCQSGEITVFSDGRDRDIIISADSIFGDREICILSDEPEVYSFTDGLEYLPEADFCELAGYILEDAYAWAAEV